MSVDHGEDLIGDAETGFWPDSEAPQAYAADTVADYPPTGSDPYQSATDDPAPARRNWWALSVAALLASAAALVVAGVHGVRELSAPATPTVITKTVVAAAPDRDQPFLDDLNRAGIHYTNRDAVVGDAYVVCVGIRTGHTVDEMQQTYAQALKHPVSEMAHFIDLAHMHYCPELVLK
ncbi:hypothetical protein A5622_11835 [Mycobacterium sp. 1245801.1]|nr:hypothetical protein A5622_11835 [Mycobacterium sp. 1245801.1]